MASLEKRELKKRWALDQKKTAINVFKNGDINSSPYGRTDCGDLDFRGLEIDEPIILNNVSSSVGVDLSHSSISKLLCIKSSFAGWKFDSGELVLLNNASVFDGCSFLGASMRNSGAVSIDSRFIRCDFKRADLTGSMFKQGNFVDCEFGDGKHSGIEFGETAFIGCRLSGSFDKCFFRGVLKHCDLTKAAFIDSAFYGATFEDCALSSNMLLFKQWPAALNKISNGEFLELSAEARKLLKGLCKVWNDLVTREELIDLAGLKSIAGDRTGEELFVFFRKIHSSMVV